MVIQETGLAEGYIGLRTLPLNTSSRSGFATDIYVCVCVFFIKLKTRDDVDSDDGHLSQFIPLL
jgi:hypothetical protein